MNINPRRVIAVSGAVAIALAGVLVQPATAHADSPDYFTIAVVPDTQFTVAQYPEILEAQMEYLRDNADDLHLAMMLQEGDVVNELASESQWETAAAAYGMLDGVVPMMFAAGNHDVQDYLAASKKSSSDALTASAARDFEEFAEDAPLAAAKLTYKTQTGRFDDFLEGFDDFEVDGMYEGDLANTYRLVDILDGKYLVMSLQFGAPAPVLAWAKSVAAEHSDRYVILLTHDYLNQKSKIRGAPGNGQEFSLPKSLDPMLENPYKMWTAFVKTSPNVKFVFSGHVNSKTPGKPYAVGALKSKNAAGKYVYSMLANYQMYGQGGNGYLRLIRIYPATKRVEVVTYSPWLDRYLTLAKDQFAFTDVNLAPLPAKP